jgi:hypothetical protein
MTDPSTAQATTVALERRYRRLLWCYPREHRRDELLLTLLEAAPPGRTRPTFREAANLLRHGLRARLGRPASRSVAVWAVLAATISGLFTGAFAARAGWETAEPLPRAEQTRATLAGIFPGQPIENIQEATSMFGIYGQPLSWDHTQEMLLLDGGEYAQAGVGGVIAWTAPKKPTAEETVQRLRQTGWTVAGTQQRSEWTTIAAHRGETTLTVTVYARSNTYFRDTMRPEDAIGVSASIQRATPTAVYLTATAGGIAGAVVAFLLFGWASRRSGPGPVPVLFFAAMLMWWGPTLFVLPFMVEHHVHEPHGSWHPMWEWLGQPTFSLLFVFGAFFAVLGLVAALPRRRQETAPARPAAP